jgi:hypothetical protein
MSFSPPEWVQNSITYETLVRWVDIFESIGCIMFGFILGLLFIQCLATKVKIDYEMPENYIVRYPQEHEDCPRVLYVNPKSVWQLLEAVFVYLCWVITGKGSTIERKLVKRARVISFVMITTLFICGIIAFISALYFIKPY